MGQEPSAKFSWVWMTWKDKLGYSRKYLLYRKELANDSPSVPSALKLDLGGKLLYLCPENDLSGLSTGKGKEGGAFGQALLQFAKALSLGFENL